jgi:hypothetical protein
LERNTIGDRILSSPVISGSLALERLLAARLKLSGSRSPPGEFPAKFKISASGTAGNSRPGTAGTAGLRASGE